MNYIGIAGQAKYRPPLAKELKNRLPNASIDSFGGYILGAIQTLFPSLYFCPLDDEDYIKSHWMDRTTFDVYEEDDINRVRIDDFILNFAHVVMKNAYGHDIWIRLMHHEFRTEGITIYYDVKTDAEQEFIKSHNGIMIGVNWNKARKDRLELKNPDFDYNLKTTEIDEQMIGEIINKFR